MNCMYGQGPCGGAADDRQAQEVGVCSEEGNDDSDYVKCYGLNVLCEL